MNECSCVHDQVLSHSIPMLVIINFNQTQPNDPSLNCWKIIANRTKYTYCKYTEIFYSHTCFLYVYAHSVSTIPNHVLKFQIFTIRCQYLLEIPHTSTKLFIDLPLGTRYMANTCAFFASPFKGITSPMFLPSSNSTLHQLCPAGAKASISIFLLVSVSLGRTLQDRHRRTRVGIEAIWYASWQNKYAGVPQELWKSGQVLVSGRLVFIAPWPRAVLPVNDVIWTEASLQSISGWTEYRHAQVPECHIRVETSR